MQEKWIMILSPRLENRPYSNHKLNRLIKKFIFTTKHNPDGYIKKSIAVLENNYTDTQLVDTIVSDSFLSKFSGEYLHDDAADIFKNSILSELLILNEYHSVKHLKNDLSLVQNLLTQG